MSQHWVYSEDRVPKNRRTIYVCKLNCWFIAFCEQKRFWNISQKDIPINKRLKRTEIIRPLFWIDYPKGKISKKMVKGKVRYEQRR